MFVGVGANGVRDPFAQAKATLPSASSASRRDNFKSARIA